jgi:L-malate glycosyltransferase
MKIAMCGPADLHALARAAGCGVAGVAPGLGSTATTPLIIELLRRGHRVTLYTLSNGLGQDALYDWDCLRIFVGSSREFGAARDFYRREIRYLRRVISADQPEFVHAHWTYEFALGALASGRPTITTIHDLPWNVLRYFRDRCRAVRLLIAYAVALRGKCFTAVSPDAARHFQRWLAPFASIQIIPNFLETSIFESGKTAVQEVDRPFTFATILQGWSRRKNGVGALRAFRIVRDTLPNSRLIMIGTDYESGGPAHTWAREQGLAEGVAFQGPMQHEAMLHYVCEQVDALVHPSLDEAFSVTILECMALRKPIVAGNRTPGLRWVLDNGDVGLLVDVRKPNAIAAAMLRLGQDRALRVSLSAAALQKAWENFRADLVVPQYEALYAEFSSRLRCECARRPAGVSA